jgi:F0F1-type ATP synthase delta subunit
MQNDQIFSEIDALVLTKEDFNQLMNEIDLLESSLYELKEGNFDEVMAGKVRKVSASAIGHFIEGKDRAQALKQIKEHVMAIQFLEITLTFEPTKKLLEKILSWVENSSQRRLAIDIKVDANIIGGAKVSYQGKYFDGSLSTKLANILKNYV